MVIPVRSNQFVISPIQGKPNAKKLSRIYNEAHKQITNQWMMLPESARENLKSNEEEAQNTEGMKSPNIQKGGLQKKVDSLKGMKSPNIQKGGLPEKVDSLNGKQRTYNEKIANKKLRNKLKKKQRAELRAELGQKKKELKEQKWAEKIKNGGPPIKNPLEERISHALNGDTSSDEDDEMEEIGEVSPKLPPIKNPLEDRISHALNGDTSSDEDDEIGEIGEVSPKLPSSSVKQRKLKKKSKKASVEEIAQEEPEEIINEVKSRADGLSKQLAKKKKNARKKEIKKLAEKKRKEEALAKFQESYLNKKLLEPQKQQEKETEVMYNKIDFETDNPIKKFKKEKPKTEKDPVKALSKIEELNKKLTELKESGNEEKAAQIKSKESWKKAILKADGVKVKDNVKLIKKTIKRNENKKSKSKTEWAQRKQTMEKRKSDAQKKRKENIMKKNKEKKQKKIKKSIKKGRVVI